MLRMFVAVALLDKSPSLSEALNAPITCNFLEACRYEWADC